MFIKPITTTNGATGEFHVTRVQENYDVTVETYINQVDYLNNKAYIRTSIISVPYTALANNPTRATELWLISTPTYLSGNIINAFSDDPLIYAKDKQWETIKLARSKAIAAIDIDASQSTVTDAVIAIRDKAKNLKTSIQAATTIEEVALFIW